MDSTEDMLMEATREVERGEGFEGRAGIVVIGAVDGLRRDRTLEAEREADIVEMERVVGS